MSKATRYNKPSMVLRRQWKARGLKDAGPCAYCGKHLEVEAVTLDHVIPLSRGGTNRISNVVRACESCQRCKQDKLMCDVVIPAAHKCRGALRHWFNAYPDWPTGREFSDWCNRHGPIIGVRMAEEFLKRERKRGLPTPSLPPQSAGGEE